MLHRFSVRVNCQIEEGIRWAGPTTAASSAYVKGLPPSAAGCAQPDVRHGVVLGGAPGGADAAWSPRPAVASVMLGRTESISQHLGGSGTGHDDHGAEGDVLENHRHAFAAAVLRHLLGLWTQLAKAICRRHGHKRIVPLFKSLRNRLAAALRVLICSKVRVSAPYSAFIPL